MIGSEALNAARLYSDDSMLDGSFQIGDYTEVIAILLEFSKTDGTRYHGTAGTRNRKAEAKPFPIPLLNYRIAKAYATLMLLRRILL